MTKRTIQTAGLVLFIAVSSFAQFGDRDVIEDGFVGITDIALGDINNDGFLDIVVSQKFEYDRIAYFLNQGDGSFSSQQIIATNIDDPHTVGIADFDADGWVDIVTASTGNFSGADSLFLLLNNQGTSFGGRIVDVHTNPIDKIFKIKVADVDNDNDPDIIATSDIALYVYYNDGKANFSKTAVDPGLILEYYELNISDIDKDGFVDIVVGATQTVIYKNTNGVFEFDSIRTQSIENFGLVFLVNLNDFDHDGDDDLLISGNNLSDLRWYENDGNGFFSLAQIFQTDITHSRSAVSEDFDSDGDVDILTIFPQTGEVVWYENLNHQGMFDSGKLVGRGDIPHTELVCAGDLTNNGKMDIVWAQELSVHLNSTISSVSDGTSSKIRRYPNPIFDKQLRIDADVDGELTVYNALGELLLTEQINKGLNVLPLDLPAQVYFLVIKKDAKKIWGAPLIVR